MSSHRQNVSPDQGGPDGWSDSSNDSEYSDTDSSMPEWDPDITEDGELVYIKYKKSTEPASTSHSKSLLDSIDGFTARNNFKRSSVRRASKGKIFKILRGRQAKKDLSRSKKVREESNSLPEDAVTLETAAEITVQVDSSKYFHSEKDCQLEQKFGISIQITEDGKSLIVSNFLPEARCLYESKVKKGYCLHALNGQELTSSNINSVIAQLRQDRQRNVLTFIKLDSDSLNIEFKNLLSSATDHEHILSQVLRDALVSLIYISCDILDDSSDDQGVLYCYPRPYTQNYLYNTRGAFVTLNHLATKGLSLSNPSSSTISVKGALFNVIYVQRDNDLMLVAVPNNIINLFGAKCATDEVVRLLEFLFGSLQKCFSERTNLYKIDHLLSRFFVMLLCEFETDSKTTVKMEDILSKQSSKASVFEDVLPAARVATLPREARLQIDDALSELESGDYREWTDDPLNCQRLYVVIGCCLYYSGHLLSSHLQDDDLIDVHAFLRVNGYLKLSRLGTLDKLVAWREIFISSYRKQKAKGVNGNEYVVPEGRWFLLIIGRGHFLLATIMEAGGCTEEVEGIPPPSPFYVEECESCLELLLDVGLARFLSGWFASNSRPQVELQPEKLVKHTKTKDSGGSPKVKPIKSSKSSSELQSSLKRRHHSSEQINEPHQPSSSHTGSHHNLYNHWYKSSVDVSHSEDSNSQLSNSEMNEERVLGRRADRERNAKDSSGSDSEWDAQGDSRASDSLDMSDMRKTLLDELEQITIHRLTAGEQNVLLHFVDLDSSRGVLLAPVKDLETASSALHKHILDMFRAASRRIHSVLQNTASGGAVNRLVGVREHGMLLRVSQHVPRSKEPYHVWVVGRVYNEPEAKELYLCYHDSVPQDMLEVAYTLSHLE